MLEEKEPCYTHTQSYIKKEKVNMKGQLHVPTEETIKIVLLLSSVGVTYEDIASKIDISADTLVKHYKKELLDGRIDSNSQVALGLFDQAKAGNTSAAIFWLKTRAGWKETKEVELIDKTVERKFIIERATRGNDD